jgi:hypothetical protein
LVRPRRPARGASGDSHRHVSVRQSPTMAAFGLNRPAARPSNDESCEKR